MIRRSHGILCLTTQAAWVIVVSSATTGGRGKPKVTFEERIDHLADRHESLTHAVELMAGQLRNAEALIMSLAEGTARLLSVAEAHERCLSHLEDSEL